MALVVLQREDGFWHFFDATISETHGKKSTATAFPVEQGAAITDHVRVDPHTLTLQSIVGEFPIAQSLGQIESTDRVQRAYEGLLRSQDEAALLTVVTTLKTYASMIITSSSVTRDAANGRILNVSLSLQQIRTASLSLTVALPLPKEPRGAATKVAAVVVGEAVTPPAVSASTLLTAFRGAASALGGDAALAALAGAAQ